MKLVLAGDLTTPPSLILPRREETKLILRTRILPHSRSHFRSEKERVRKNEKQNENEEQKESLDKTAKALSFYGEGGS